MAQRYFDRLPLVFGLGLAACWLGVILVDMLNIGGSGEYVIYRHPDNGSLFHLLFLNEHPVEWMQWSCLALSAMIAAQVSLIKDQNGETEGSLFNLLMGVLFAVLLMEDAGDIRHTVSNNLTPPLGQPFSGF